MTQYHTITEIKNQLHTTKFINNYDSKKNEYLFNSYVYINKFYMFMLVIKNERKDAHIYYSYHIVCFFDII